MNPADRRRAWTAFKNIRDLVSSRFEYLPDIALQPCKMADAEHRKSDRQYAHVFHVQGAVCAASAIKDLTKGNLYGVFLHEFGHLIVDHETHGTVPEDEIENAADEAILRAFGIHIFYDGFSGQPTVEWATPATVERAVMDARLSQGGR